MPCKGQLLEIQQKTVSFDLTAGDPEESAASKLGIRSMDYLIRFDIDVGQLKHGLIRVLRVVDARIEDAGPAVVETFEQRHRTHHQFSFSIMYLVYFAALCQEFDILKICVEKVRRVGERDEFYLLGTNRAIGVSRTPKEEFSADRVVKCFAFALLHMQPP